jgi:hypothetical protein
MEPEQLGRKFGIGVRVAGRIAKKMAEQQASAPPGPATGSLPISGSGAGQTVSARPSPEIAARARELGQKTAGLKTTHNVTRAAGRGLGGFLRPFRRVGGILWLEVTGFFFGLFALYFATDIWKTHQDYAQGPLHQRFLIAVGCAAVFSYLSLSSFWRARRK